MVDCKSRQDRKDTNRNLIELKRRLRIKNFAVAGVLAGLALLFYLVALVRMSGG